MLKNYLVTALRVLRRQKLYGALNVVGLAIGLACAALIFGYVRLEQSFDRFHADADRIYRVVQHQPGNLFMGSDRFVVTQAPLGQALREEAPEVEAAATFGQTGEYLVGTDRARFVEEGFYADERFFEVFSFPLERGDAATALREPDTVVLTATLARKLFGEADPVGQTVFVGGDRLPYRVTGVAADPPAASHLQFAYLLSLASSHSFARDLNAWDNSSWYTYLVLRPGASTAALERRLAEIHARHREAEPGEELPRLYLEPLTAVHLHSRINFDVSENGDARLVALFSAIAVVILLLACVNYTNLAVARSARRAREVGMRKALGASRGHVVGQHLAESVLTALIALGLGLLLARLALPLFESWMGRDLGAVAFSVPSLLVLVGVAVVVGLVAGAYPAFALTAMQPVRVLKGQEVLPAGRVRLRSVLVVGQYAAALVLVVGSLVISRQMAFVQGRALGFDRAHVLTLHTLDLDAEREVPALKEALSRLPGVVGVTASSHLPTNVESSTLLEAWEGHPEGSGEPIQLYQVHADADFFDVYGMRIVAGRAFSPAFPTDTAGAVVLNETAVRALGWTPETALGKTLDRDGEPVPVVGVVADFHMHAMHRPIEPLLLQLTTGWINRLAIRVVPERLSETLAAVERSWGTLSEYPFEYAFLDDDFARLYEADRKLGEGVLTFTVVALFIACLGLFGLAAYTAERRTKEVGIRKALGASVGSLVGLLSKDFLKLVVVSLVVATPLAYYAISRWLEAFAYRIDLGADLFLTAGALAVGIALLAVSGQALRAASADPVKALRYE